MDLINSLKKILKNLLKAVYRRALNSNKCHLTSQALERQVTYAGIPEGQRFLCQRFSKIVRKTGITPQPCSYFRGDARNRAPERKHPPPLTRA